jgi:nucleoside phosphorylase
MRRRSVARVAVGTAVVAGTAGAVHHHQDKKYAQQDAAQQQPMEEEGYEEYEDYEQPAAAPQDDVITQLERLGALKDQGILTEEEFAAQKAKLLGI